MRRKHRPAIVTAALAAASAAALALGLAAPAQAAKPAPKVAPGPYVALGDSFSAGSGVLPLTSANPLCAQSALNYPHLIAQRTGRALTDATCGGADTNDFYSAQYPGTPAQLSRLASDARFVTIGIGGNDSSVFTSIIQNCMTAGLTTLGFGSPCKNKYGSSYATTIQTKTYPAVRKAIADARAKAPKATIVVAGYPQVLPPTKGCYLAMPIASGDVPYVNGIEQILNGVIEQAARDNGVTFVDMWAPSAGRDACQLPWVRWVEPAIGSLQFVPVHPNAAGERAYADQIMAKVNL
ncbi:SGNH/GDSL hydrolase family protein [Knoellia subterranea]|uniref:Lipase n=1 Tax=Knoellia subterranea KCTC 19937 TaxID=1385521 RepID=A0A0A0JM96_9MICO|nr:SGNH/GDSL hydrolase family protein [Knoellia subterranea]KGN38268.1 lipase [Knoellia subterranea KCTC 19937]